MHFLIYRARLQLPDQPNRKDADKSPAICKENNLNPERRKTENPPKSTKTPNTVMYELVLVSACWKKALAAHRQEDSAPPKVSTHTADSSCKHQLYSPRANPMEEEEEDKHSRRSPPEPSVLQLMNQISITSLVPLLQKNPKSHLRLSFLLLPTASSTH